MQSDIPFTVGFKHRFRTTSGVFAPENGVLRDVLEPSIAPTQRVAVFLDSGVERARPGLAEEISAYWSTHRDLPGLAGPPTVLPGGEAVKNDERAITEVLGVIDRDHLCRHSFVLAIGGGAVLDAVGYGAAIAHRGVRLVRLPTTTLAQGDSGVGVKNGINAFGKKNFLGTFAPPWGVINDGGFLATLAERDWRSGFSEAVKVGLVKDASLFDDLERSADAIRRRDPEASLPLIERSARLHLGHITESGDPFERSDARPLDFGHWSAHKLEQLTGFRMLHGEAVAIGVAIDAAYSHLSGWLDEASTVRIVACLRSLGFDLALGPGVRTDDLLEGVAEFREHLGGRTCVAMLRGIGDAFDADEIESDRVCRAIDWVAAATR